MLVSLIRFTHDPDELCARAAAKCYNSNNPERARDHAIDGGHLSITEHAVFTFDVAGVSRALLAQLTRHRIASFSVQSQRYISLDNCFEYVIPPAIEALGSAQVMEYKRQMAQMHMWYCQWQTKLGGPCEKANEDARMVLPAATCTSLLVTMNARELMHFFELRCCHRAQWEIREMADQMLRCCKAVAPALFAEAGPGCVNGKGCPEGKRSCGVPRLRREWE